MSESDSRCEQKSETHGLQIVARRDSAPAEEEAPATITQQDLAEVVALRQQKKAVEAELKKRRFLIRHGLENGALVEPGLRSARLEIRLKVS